MRCKGKLGCLASEAVQSTSLPLQSVHHIEGCDSLATSVLCVGDGIPDHVLEEHLQDESQLRPTGRLARLASKAEQAHDCQQNL